MLNSTKIVWLKRVKPIYNNANTKQEKTGFDATFDLVHFPKISPKSPWFSVI